MPSCPGRRICLSIVVLVSSVVRRLWSARVAERESRLAAHAEFVFCEQSIERTFAWLGQARRLAKDYERLPETGVAMSRLMLRRLVRATC